MVVQRQQCKGRTYVHPATSGKSEANAADWLFSSEKHVGASGVEVLGLRGKGVVLGLKRCRGLSPVQHTMQSACRACTLPTTAPDPWPCGPQHPTIWTSFRVSPHFS